MKIECSIVRDLLPLYVEDMVSPETTQYIKSHLAECSECQAEFYSLTEDESYIAPNKKHTEISEDSTLFKTVMKRMNRQFYSLAYAALIFLIFLGFGWTDGENLMYNSVIMPIVGIFGYYVFRWKALFKVPLLLLLIDMFIFIFQLVEIGFTDTLAWTCIYGIFVIVGIIIAFLLHFAFRKENKK